MSSIGAGSNHPDKVRVIQFACGINRFDFIDVIIQWADPDQFELGVCVATEESNIARPVYPERTPRWVIPWKPRRGLIGAARRLAGVLREWRPDILHTHHYDEAVIGWMATRWHPQTKLVVGRHYSDSLYRLPSRVKRGFFLGVESIVNRGASRIVVPSEFIRTLLTEDQGVDAAKVDLIPYAMDPQKYPSPSPEQVRDLRREFDLEGRLALGIFGRIDGQKGHLDLLVAVSRLAARHPDLRVLIVGEGPRRQTVEQRIEELGLGEIVRVLGWRFDALLLMAAVDVVVQPTLQEAFSQVMVEALWLGKPLIMTDVSGAPDVIRDGETGLLVPRQDPMSLANAIDRLTVDPTLRLRIGAEGQAFVRRYLALERLIPQYEATYLKALGRLSCTTRTVRASA